MKDIILLLLIHFNVRSHRTTSTAATAINQQYYGSVRSRRRANQEEGRGCIQEETAAQQGMCVCVCLSIFESVSLATTRSLAAYCLPGVCLSCASRCIHRLTLFLSLSFSCVCVCVCVFWMCVSLSQPLLSLSLSLQFLKMMKRNSRVISSLSVEVGDAVAATGSGGRGKRGTTGFKNSSQTPQARLPPSVLSFTPKHGPMRSSSASMLVPVSPPIHGTFARCPFLGSRCMLVVCTCVHVCVSVCVYMCVCMCACLCVHLWMWACMSVCLSVHVWMWACTCVCMCVHMCLCVCIYVRTYNMSVAPRLLCTNILSSLISLFSPSLSTLVSLISHIIAMKHVSFKSMDDDDDGNSGEFAMECYAARYDHSLSFFSYSRFSALITDSIFLNLFSSLLL